MSNTQTDNARDIDAVMPMHNFIEYIGNYSKTSGSLWQYCRNEPSDQVVNSNSFKSKIKMTEKNHCCCNLKVVKISAPLKYLSNFWRILEMPLINYEINLILTCLKLCYSFRN